MIKIENIKTIGFDVAIQGMRNPFNSWSKSDSHYENNGNYVIGNDDLELMLKLVKAGTDHGKFMRFINVTCDITAPLYWWKEYDTYKVGTVANSCSTMHTIHKQAFTIDDFSWEHLYCDALDMLQDLIDFLNDLRDLYNDDRNTSNQKEVWYNIIQLLPSSYNQKRTVQLNYQVLRNIYFARKNHKLDEWQEFCKWIIGLPYSDLIVAPNGLQ